MYCHDYSCHCIDGSGFYQSHSIIPCLYVGSVGLYCAAKAGREMYHQVVALEQSQKSVVVSEANTIEEMQASCTAFATAGCLKVLNYAPGPIDTQVSNILSSYLVTM